MLKNGLTQTQLITLAQLKKDKRWHHLDLSKASKQTLKSLQNHGLIKNTLYENGYNWELTDIGLYKINEMKKIFK